MRAKAFIISLTVLSLFLAGCGIFATKVKFTSRFDSVGLVENSPSAANSIQANEVKIYYNSSPQGFTLKNNELQVEEGFNHKILGPIEIRAEVENFGGSKSCHELQLGKERVIQELQIRAAKEGANAVIYADSRLGPSENYTVENNVCFEIRKLIANDINAVLVGYGFAVIVQE